MHQRKRDDALSADEVSAELTAFQDGILSILTRMPSNGWPELAPPAEMLVADGGATNDIRPLPYQNACVSLNGLTWTMVIGRHWRQPLNRADSVIYVVV
jgi:hypothetical protein